ncbi:MAG: DUF4255 domain-containing protein [Chitinophagaceae bacterium]|nr:DUF4255 domain-containing protein [Chitinophagaceae bacterium]
MIASALQLLIHELEQFLKRQDDSVEIRLDNIALLETSGSNSLTDSIIISLVNIEEESTKKNHPALKRPFGNTAIYENPPVFLNLYILLTCNYSGDKYVDALRRLSSIIKFLQRNPSFSNTSSLTGGMVGADPDLPDLRFTMELYTLTFEQINHLWGSLGGRQIPFVLYKLRLVSISDHVTVRETPLIEEIETSLNPK